MMSRRGPLQTQPGGEELRIVLERALARTLGASRRVVGLDRHPITYCTSYSIEELSVRFADGATLDLIFKDLSRDALLETARRIKPAFLYDPLREIEAYLTVLAGTDLGTAACYGSAVDHEIGRYWLFLENVPGTKLSEVGDLKTWRQVARWLASMHARFLGETGTLARAAPLLRYERNFYGTWMHRAQEFLDRAGSPNPRAVRRRVDLLARRYGRVVERLLVLPATLIHGEFYASNVLVHGTGGRVRVCPVDWEMAAVGPGLVDLAALVAGGWSARERTALAMAYFEESMLRNAGWSGEEQFLSSLDYCRLHLAVQWLGWSPAWSPPPEHAHDWLREALGLAEKLELA
jgi:aminoglycoside phosphotransferase (APT) family kinase protein